VTRYISITLAIPDGVDVHVEGGPHDREPRETLPPPKSFSPEEPERAFGMIAADRNRSSAGCPVHSLPWRTVPAGTSKRTGRPYQSFLACPEPGCDERPALSRRTAS
jgi:hypothetical protein